jgi:hypothetical protein
MTAYLSRPVSASSAFSYLLAPAAILALQQLSLSTGTVSDTAYNANGTRLGIKLRTRRKEQVNELRIKVS